MNIKITNLRGLHYFDNHGFLINCKGEIIVLTPLQTKVIGSLLKSNNSEDILANIAQKFDGSLITARCHIDQIIKNYPEYFAYSEDKRVNYCNLLVSGRLGMMFPYDLNIALTKKCGQKCKHCLSNASCEQNQEIPYASLKDFLHTMRGNIKNICLTGGEPFLYSHIKELVKEFSEDYFFSAVTSGCGIKNLSDDIFTQMDTIQISIHGGNEKQHDEFVQKKGAFAQVDEFIKRIQGLGLNYVIVTQAKNNDINHLKTIIEYCIKRNVKKIIIGELSPIGRAKEMPIWEYYDTIIVQNNIKNLAKKYGKEIEVCIDDEIYKKVRVSKHFFSCGAGTLKWFISDRGDIYPCMLGQDKLYKIGSIINSTYMDLVSNSQVYCECENLWNEKACELPKFCENMRGLSSLI